MTYIETTLGKINIKSLGRLDVHEHVIIDGGGIERLFPDFIHNDVDKISIELIDWKKNGGGAIIDCSPIEAGRNIEKLEKISQITHIPIIAVTGFHKPSYYSPNYWFFGKTVEEIKEIFFLEYSKGINIGKYFSENEKRSLVRAGIIKLGIDRFGITPLIKKLITASIDLIKEYNIPLMLHTEPGVPFEKLFLWFKDNNVPPEKVLFCHMDKVLDIGLHKLLTSNGFFIEYDSMVRKNPALSDLAMMIKELFSKGLGSRILFAGDLARRSYWKCYGGEPGLSYLMLDLNDDLYKLGLTSMEIEKIWVENPKSWLN